MPCRISITHSTYENVMDILIEGKTSIDAYSPIRQFTDRPFHEWCSKIFQYISDEIGAGYEFEFCGSLEETPVMSALALSEKDCEKFIPRISQIAMPLSERMSFLCKLIKKYGIDFGPQIPYAINFISTSTPSLFSSQISQLDVQNSFCKLSFSEKDYPCECRANDTNFYLVDNMDNAVSLTESNGGGRPYFILINSEKSGFVGKRDDAFIYLVSRDSFFDVVFECLLLIPLKMLFLMATERLLNMVDNTEIKSHIRGLMASSPIWRISAAREIELGKSVEIYCEASPPHASKPELIFTYQLPGIVECTQTRVFGRREGSTKVYVARKGSSGMLGELDFTVSRRNRITELMLSETSIVLGEGDTFKLEVDYVPEDADNVDSIRWNAWPTATVEVTDGLVTARKEGAGRIVCNAGTASAQCHILVLPWLVEMNLPEAILKNGLILHAGNEYVLDVQIAPENAIDSEIIISSDNLLVANIIDSKIVGVDSGTATVTVENSSGRFKRSFRVVVKI